MACPNGKGFCGGPGSSGHQCLACQKAEQGAVPMATAPVAVAAATAATASNALARPAGVRRPPTPPPRSSKPAHIVAALAKPVIPSATLSTFTPASPVTLAMPVAEPSAPAVAAPASADTSGTDLPFVYRSDSRDLKTLQKTSGFQPWEPFTLQQSRDLLKLYARAIELAQCSFREKVGKHGLALEESAISPNRTPLDLSQWVIRSKARGPSVSTDPREDCGGYNNGFIYKIDCRHLHPVDWKSAIPGMRARQTAWWPKLYLDSDSLDTATAIAMKSKGDTEEVTFFTPIAFDLISLR